MKPIEEQKYVVRIEINKTYWYLQGYANDLKEITLTTDINNTEVFYEEIIEQAIAGALAKTLNGTIFPLPKAL